MPSSADETSAEPVGGTTVPHPPRRRGRRGRGGRGRRSAPVQQPDRATPVPPPEASREVVEPVVPMREAASLPRPEPERPRTAHPIRSAIDEVNRIIEGLKTVLSEMEEVVELLEMAEVQKEVDERELAALQQALRRLQRGQETRHGSGPARPPRPAQEPPQ